MVPKKPEWFELADSDQPEVTVVTRRRRVRPVIALVVSGAIIGTGALFANVEDKEIAHADDVVAPSIDNNAGISRSDDPSTSNGAVANDSTPQNSTNNSKSAIANPSTTSGNGGGVANPSTQDKIQNPMTSGGGRNHEFGEDDDDDHKSGLRPPRHGHDDERHGFGEREGDDD